MEPEEIITQTLNHLDNWITTEQATTDELPITTYNKKIPEDEIITTYTTANDYAKSYTNRETLDNILIADTAVCLWTAGLLWEKYNVRVNNQEDETNPYGYGDKLIMQAKEMLKPFKKYSLHAF